MKEITISPLDPSWIGKYPNVDNRQGNWATAVWDKHTEMWYVQSFRTAECCIVNAAHYREPRFGNMFMYECRWKNKWMLVGALDNCLPGEMQMSHPPARGGRKKAS